VAARNDALAAEIALHPWPKRQGFSRQSGRTQPKWT
jgi:hypothetical protein